jgi:uncharacterized repeat protein (TIGR01451 family)
MINQILSINLFKKTTASFAVLCLLIVSILTSFAFSPVSNALGAPITGTLFVDFSRDGIIDLGEKVPITDKYYPTSRITVTAYDDLGNSVLGTVTSGSNGVTYSVDPSSLSGTKFRLVFGLSATDKQAGWTETFNGKDSQSSVVIVSAGAVQNFGVIPPSKAPVTGTGADGNTNNYNGKLFATEFINGARDDTTGPQNVLLGLNYDRTGGVENLSNKPKLGSIWGLAYDEWSSNLFTSAYLKRHVELGPEGLDGLYWITYPNETLKQVSLETLGGPSFGTIGSRDSDNIAYYQSSRDATSFSKIDKIGIGDIDVSKDGRTLFVTNIAAKAIMAYDVSNAANGTISYLGNYSITNADAACPNNSGNNNPSDWYPFALEPIDGDSLYVGITCNAQTSQSRLDLTAKVLELTLTPAGTNNNVIPISSKLVHSVNLNYAKGCPILGYCTVANQGGFHPWQDDYTKFPQAYDPDGSRVIYPQPVLTDINISRDGSMTLNIMDRTTDQFGYRNYDPAGNFIRAYAGGDIIKVCNTSSNSLTPTYLTEGVAGCIGTNSGQGPNNSSTEFYFDDFPGYHSDTTLGGAWTHPYLNEIVSGQFDPLTTGSLITGGISWLNTAVGSEITAKELYSGGNDVGFSGKANGIGDIEGAYVPVAIGDYVWLDSDGDGIQDPNEQPLAGVSVTITCQGIPGGSKTVLTNANGKYEFTSADGLVPGSVCSIKFNPATATNLPAGITPASLTPTKAVAGTDPLSDSNINSTGTLTTLPLVLGQVNHSYDAGFVPPIKAIDDNNTTPLNTPITYCPLANDMAPVGSKITVINGITVVVGTPINVTNGKVVVNADGCITFTPNPGYTGTVTFPYTITSPNGQTSSAIDTITITGTGKIDLIKAGTFIDSNANGAAEVGETIKYTFTVKNSGSLVLNTVTVTDNKCSPVLGGPIATLAVGAIDTTTFSCNYTLTAADIAAGLVNNQATVNAKDPTGKTVTNTSDSTDPTKPGLNDPTVTPLPVKAIDDIKTTPINTPIKYCPLINDMVPAGSKITGINGLPATVGVPIVVPNGTVTLEADGCVTFTPATGYTGTVTFPYEVTTPNGTKVTAIDTITIPVVPVANPDVKETPINTPVKICPLANDMVPAGSTITGINGQPATVGVPITVPNGTVTLLQDGCVTFTPNTGFTGTVTFPYEVTTPAGVKVTSTITVTVVGAVDDTKVTPINTPIKYCPLINDMVPTGSKITSINGIAAIVGTPIVVPNGTVTLEADGCVTFTPNPGYTGTVTFPYEVTTSAGTVVKAIDTITIVGSGSIELIKASTFVDANFNSAAEVGEIIKYTFTVKNTGPLALTNVKVTDNKCAPVLGGPISLAVGASDTTTFTCTYPLKAADIAAEKVENSATVTGQDPTGKPVTDISDSTDPSKPGSNDPTITPLPPIAVDDIKTTPMNTPIKYCPLINDMVPAGSKITSINGQAATVGVPITVPNGTVTLEADGCVTFTPATGFTGVVTFPYEVTTPSGKVVKAIDTITIPDASVANPDVKETPINTPVKICPLANDMVPAGSKITGINGQLVTAGVPVQVPNGTVTLDADGCITFTPAPGYTGTVTFPYEVTTPTGVKVTSTVTVTIVGAVDDSKTTPVNIPIKYCPLINDMVPTGSKITSINGVTAIAGTPITVPNGTVTLEADGCVTFTPNKDYTGTVTFPYEVTTPNGTVVKAIDTIVIPASIPVLVDDNKVTPVNTPITYSPMANDLVPNGSTITQINGTPVVIGQPIVVPNGTVIVNADQTVTFTPAKDYTGQVVFPYEVTTPAGVKVKAIDTITIVSAVDDTKVTNINTPITYCPLINDMVPAGSKITAINGITLTVGVPVKVPNATVVLNADGCITVTPDKDFVGDIKFPYTVTTPSGDKVTANDTITINGEGKIELDKAATYVDANNDGKLSIGETIKYTFTIKNTGATTLTNVTVTDTMPGIMIAGTPIPSLAPGATNNTAYTATYIVTQADIDKGMVVNQATVSGTDPKGNTVKDLSNDPTTTLGNDPTTLYIPKATPPCAGTTGCNSGCGTGNCMPISSISCITNTNNVTITGGAGPMMSPVYNYNNVFNSNVNFTQGPINFNFSPVVNNYYK